ncbi:MAG TPA: purine nucleoside permease [Sphingobium sp.]|jgi:purine nucleoside permease|uniref:purine nucleoside permease n=1 Tax=Sphingobium sp. TaxID=1912891 RepID=UPI000ED73135|nr:purine nucleoside permease [Sphingobium sp.]HAF42186.1 purine nucleoside permease [Sphingobium sp.]
MAGGFAASALHAIIATAAMLVPIPAAFADEPPVPVVPAIKPIPVKVIVIANFEPGEDKGDVPGEFQLWAEREKLDEVIPIKGALHPLRRNGAGLYGMCWGSPDTMLGGVAEQLMSLLLDPRFDFSKTYWLFTGISGVDPQVASVGSAAWSRWVVQGDTLREFDDREVAKDWPYGLFAIGADAPNKLPANTESFAGFTDTDKLAMAVKLNQSLAQWAYDRTRDVVIPDSPELQKARAAWKGYPNAQKPPFVLMGETLGALRYWHGPGRTQWARDWVKLWTGGKGRFAMTNMESQSLAGAMAIAAKQGLVDPARVLVLRTGSNPSMPPPGQSAVDSVANEGAGQVAAYEANYRVGAPVVQELLAHWNSYKDQVPGSDPR